MSAKKGIRRRFFVDKIESLSTQPGPPNLYYCDDQTHIRFSPGSGGSSSSSGNQVIEEPLSLEYIGGIAKQAQALNMRIKRILKQTMQPMKQATTDFQENEGILIHGYEGTGKSLLLKRLEHYQFRKILGLQKSSLNSALPGKNVAVIEGLFSEAKANQPSLILMDDLQKLAPAAEDPYTDTIIAEIDKLMGSHVLIVATCRNPGDVNSILTDPGRLSALIELPIPDQHAREQILKVLINSEHDPDRAIVTAMSLRTHGFTGKDLARLVKVAQSSTLDRRDQQQALHEQWIVRVGANGSLERLLDGQAEAGAREVAQQLAATPEQIASNTLTAELTMDDFESALTKVRPTALREIFFEQPKVRWDQIGGSQAIKERFDKVVNWPLQHSAIMEQYRKRPKKGVLLYGPPGCSKTLTAQAVATTYSLNFIAVKGAELISMYVGESERAVRDIFRKARAAAPCVIFFDEIDSIASEREDAGTKGLNVLTTLLNEMDGFDSLKNVLVLAATNKPEILDSAIMRPGRFDSHIYLGPPNDQARKEIFDMLLNGLPIEEDMDFNKLVKATEGYSGAEIVQIIDLATDEAMGRKIEGKVSGAGTVGMADFERALGQTKKAITSAMLATYQAFAMSAAAP